MEYAEINHLGLEKTDTKIAFQFKKLVEVHMNKKQRVSEYADMLNISRISLNEAVKKQFNITAVHLLKQRLLSEIKDYLIYSNLTIAEIAYKLNFSDPSHLMRFFKAATGQTAGNFRSQYI
ncbi:helix-turn-helix domain-containing protein [Chryseobacterium pennae]|nr:helix-turn-helix domain-containing protein [Chryseobacterium pennae]